MLQRDSEAENWAFLTTCTDEQEANMIESFLACENIFIFKKYLAAGDYLRIACGTTIFGIDLFVKESQLKRAKEIMEEIAVPLDKEQNPAETRSENSTVLVQNNGSKKFVFLIGIMVILIVLFLIMLVFNYPFDLKDYEILGK